MEFNASDSPVDPKSDNSVQPLTGAGNFRNEATAKGVGAGYIICHIRCQIRNFSVDSRTAYIAFSGSAGSLHPNRSRQKLEYLDGLRGIICLVVLCDHWLMMGYYNCPALVEVDPQQVSPFFDYLLIRSPLLVFVAGEFAFATFFVRLFYTSLQ
jgi:hypothetical protein